MGKEKENLGTGGLSLWAQAVPAPWLAKHWFGVEDAERTVADSEAQGGVGLGACWGRRMQNPLCRQWRLNPFPSPISCVYQFQTSEAERFGSKTILFEGSEIQGTHVGVGPGVSQEQPRWFKEVSVSRTPSLPSTHKLHG